MSAFIAVFGDDPIEVDKSALANVVVANGAAHYDSDFEDFMNHGFLRAKEENEAVAGYVDSIVLEARRLLSNLDRNDVSSLLLKFKPDNFEFLYEEEDYDMHHIPNIFFYSERVSAEIINMRSDASTPLPPLLAWMESVREQIVEDKKQQQLLLDIKITEYVQKLPRVDDGVAAVVGKRRIIQDYEELKGYSEGLMEYNSEEESWRKEWLKKEQYHFLKAYDFFRAQAFAEVFGHRFILSEKLKQVLEAKKTVTHKMGTKGYLKKEIRESLVRRFRSAYMTIQMPYSDRPLSSWSGQKAERTLKKSTLPSAAEVIDVESLFEQPPTTETVPETLALMQIANAQTGTPSTVVTQSVFTEPETGTPSPVVTQSVVTEAETGTPPPVVTQSVVNEAETGTPSPAVTKSVMGAMTNDGNSIDDDDAGSMGEEEYHSEAIDDDEEEEDGDEEEETDDEDISSDGDSEDSEKSVDGGESGDGTDDHDGGKEDQEVGEKTAKTVVINEDEEVVETANNVGSEGEPEMLSVDSGEKNLDKPTTIVQSEVRIAFRTTDEDAPDVGNFGDDDEGDFYV
jgi:hypothetical protein